MPQETKETTATRVVKQVDTPQKETNGFVPFAKRILATSTILVVLATVAALSMGYSSLSINREIKEHEYFISVAKEVQPNFEDSLSLYTGDTQEIIEFLLSLRPDSEEDYITFITTLEGLGDDLSLDLDVSSVEASKSLSQANTEASGVLEYDVSFYGSFKNLQSFVESLDELPYYVKVSNIKYSDPNGSVDDKNRQLPNVTVKIKLYIK